MFFWFFVYKKTSTKRFTFYKEIAYNGFRVNISKGENKTRTSYSQSNNHPQKIRKNRTSIFFFSLLKLHHRQMREKGAFSYQLYA